MLECAAQIAVLLLEMERVHGRPSLAVRSKADGAAPLIGSSAAIRAVRERIERVAATDFTVLIEGESGTGKELVARQIHELSRRRRGPFVAVNCAAIVETLIEAELFGIEERTATGVRGRRGKFEHAHDGTLFLDEVSDLSPAAQAKLLRAIQDMSIERVGACGARRVDTRIIVATNRPLLGLVERGQFRLDLFYRLHGVEVQVPPLRARRDDVAELAQYFLERHRLLRSLQLSAAALDALVAYHWPGNVRELERVIERAVALADGEFLELDDLPPAITGGYVEVLLPAVRARESMRAWGSRYARLVYERCGSNKRQACRELGISYHTLRAYLAYQPERAARDERAEDQQGAG
jgi:transcriptional regulator with PAS, ATPase and Fis domain